MKRIIFIAFVVMLCSNELYAQSLRNEIGIGWPSISINDKPYSNSIAAHLFNNSEIYPPRLQAKKINSFASPILYFTRNISNKYFIITSISYQQEILIFDTNSHVIVEDPEIGHNYQGKFSQVKLNIGFGFNLIQDKKFKFFGHLDLTNCFKTLSENWVNLYPLYYVQRRPGHYIGFTPTVGLSYKISRLLSIFFESAAEISYPTNTLFPNLLFWNPLNRLSLNCHF